MAPSCVNALLVGTKKLAYLAGSEILCGKNLLRGVVCKSTNAMHFRWNAVDYKRANTALLRPLMSMFPPAVNMTLVELSPIHAPVARI